MNFNVAGAGTIEAVDAATVESFHADHRQAFNGLAPLIVRSRAGQPGKIDISANGEGLAPGAIEVAAEGL